MKWFLSLLVVLGFAGALYAYKKETKPSRLSDADVWHRRSILNEAKTLGSEKEALEEKFKKLQAEYDALVKPYAIVEGDKVADDGVITRAPKKPEASKKAEPPKSEAPKGK